MRQHNKYIKYYMPQMQKDNVIDKPELFGTTDEEYEKNKVAGHFKFIVSPENQNVNLNVLINVRTQTHRIYVPVYQLHKQNLEEKHLLSPV